jgi:L-threonylcarbamoyladenylate synthase
MKMITDFNPEQFVADFLNGKVFVFPTESSYGMGCDATNQAAVDKIFKIKGRTVDKPLLVVVPSIEMAKQYITWNSVLDYLAKNYWPGPLTIVGMYAMRGAQTPGLSLADGVVSKDSTVAIRLTSHPLLQLITKKMHRPLVATSANLAGKAEPYDAAAVAEYYLDKMTQPDYILDFGALPPNKPSTLISVVGGECRVLRQGELYVDITSAQFA